MKRSTDAERYVWLLGKGDPPGRATHDDIRAACELVLTWWRVLPAIAPKLLEWVGDAKGTEGAVDRVRDRVAAVVAFGQVQERILLRLTEAFEKQGIGYTLLKSAAVRLLAYDEPLQRCGVDFDVGVSKRDIRQAERIALAHGFIQAQFDWNTLHYSPADLTLRRRVEDVHYELGFLARRTVVSGLDPEVEAALRRDLPGSPIWHQTRDGRLACYVNVDLHHGISHEISTDEILRSRRRVPLQNESVVVPQDSWLLLHLVHKVYWEGVHNYGQGVYQFADVVRLVPRMEQRQLDAFIELLDRWTLRAAGHYVLRRLPDDLGTPLPDKLATFVDEARWPRPKRDPRSLNDLGDMWPKLFGHR